MTKEERAKRKKDLEDFVEKCTHCHRHFMQTQYGALCDAILNRMPHCSFECNKALGQV